MAVILLLSGPASGTRFEIASEVTLGRSPGCDIPLEDTKVSRRHARLELRDTRVFLKDLGSRNGTTVNGSALQGEHPLSPGDRFQVGETEVLFDAAAPVPVAVSTFSQAPAESLLSAPAREDASVWSSALSAPSAGAALSRLVTAVADALGADKAGVTLGGGDTCRLTLRRGTESSDVPRALVEAVTTQNRLQWDTQTLGAPLATQGAGAMGALFFRKPGGFTESERRIAAQAGRRGAELYTSLRTLAGLIPPGAVMGSEASRERFARARTLSEGSRSVLFVGEPGAGKRFAAGYLHAHSDRGDGALVVVDCRLPASLLDEQILGRPATLGVPGLLPAVARAERGTLLLHHVEALPRLFAERITRTLSMRTLQGPDGVELPVDVRVLLSSGLAAAELQTPGAHAAELLRALDPELLDVPPLRGNTEDVVELVRHSCVRAAAQGRRELPRLSPEANRMLSAYRWPGNVDEVQLVAERLVLLFGGQEVSALHLPIEIREASAASTPRTLQEMVSHLERDAILEALRQARGRKIHAAAALGISRPTLDKKIEDYGLTVEKNRGP